MSDVVGGSRRTRRPRHGTRVLDHPILLLSLLALLALVAFVAVRLGAFELTAVVALPDGRSEEVVNTFAGVDHPFHATRAATLLESLREGRIPRWIGHHQGGYPAEFYPLGGAWIEVLVWSLLLGSLPILAVHKIAVIAIFLLPLLGFLLLARSDHLPAVVAVTAGAAHVSMPGGSFEGGAYSGGYRELVSWGLFTNVSAAVVILLTMALLVRYVRKGGGWFGALAASGAALALTTNPRSGIALLAAGIATVMVLGVDRRGRGLAPVARRLGIVAGIAALLAAPLLVSLLRYNHLYHFVRYSGYRDIGDYVSASISSVTLPVLALALAGAVWAYSAPDRLATRAAALTWLVYAVITVAISLGGDGEGPFDQLEATRLMPFQRLIVLYLAGVGVHALVVSALPPPKHRMPAGLIQLGLALAIVAGFVFTPFGGLAEEDRGLFPVPTTAAPSMVSLRDAVATADEIAPEGTALYVVGSALSWHQQLWAPLWTERPLRYNDWLWSWQADHAAPGYSSLDGNAFSMKTVSQTFDTPFLDQEGIGAVVVTGQTATAAADASSALRLAADGLYRVYEVVEPPSVVTLDSGHIDDIAVERERLSATGVSPGGLATIRINWFPRWRATVNGDEVPVQRTADGYMAVAVPPGVVDVRLSYTVTALDWLARAASGLGILAVVALLVTQARSNRPVTPMARWGRR